MTSHIADIARPVRVFWRLVTAPYHARRHVDKPEIRHFADALDNPADDLFEELRDRNLDGTQRKSTPMLPAAAGISARPGGMSYRP